MGKKRHGRLSVTRVVFMAVPGFKFISQGFHFVSGHIAALFPAKGVVFFQAQGIEVGCFDEGIRVQAPEVESRRFDVYSLAGFANGFDRDVHEVGRTLHGPHDGHEHPRMVEHQHLFGLPEGAVAFTSGFHVCFVLRFGG